MALGQVNLKVALGVSQDSPITLSDMLDSLAGQLVSLPNNSQEAQRFALAHRSELTASAQKVEAAKAAFRDAQECISRRCVGSQWGTRWH